jgi:hypothetical protein
MATKNLLSFERSYECLSCHEAVSNPICPDCLSFQIEAWLTSISAYPLKNKIMKRIRDYINSQHDYVGESTICIVCGKTKASICPYCFTNYVYALLKCLNVNKSIIKEFLQFFNYDLEHNGYSKDAEELGYMEY